MNENFTLREAKGFDDMQVVQNLIKSYMTELGENLCFQGVVDELANLPGNYARPDGVIYLGTIAGESKPGAMIALRKLDAGTCEMKRLYVAPQHRSHGIGEALVKRLIVQARQCGYGIMRLDTLARLKPAIALYKRFGFVETSAYNDATLEGITYFMKEL